MSNCMRAPAAKAETVTSIDNGGSHDRRKHQSWVFINPQVDIYLLFIQ